MKIYQIDSSARKKGSTSRALAKKLLDKIKKPEDEVIYRDLDDEMLFVSGLTESGMNIDEKDQTEEHKKMFELSDKLVKELKESDIIIISAPIYNYGPPATLKAWSDLAARIGETFRFKPNGRREGLLKNKHAYLVITSGGTKLNSSEDFLTPWLKFILNFFGIEKVDIISADQMALDYEKSISVEKYNEHFENFSWQPFNQKQQVSDDFIFISVTIDPYFSQCDRGIAMINYKTEELIHLFTDTEFLGYEYGDGVNNNTNFVLEKQICAHNFGMWFEVYDNYLLVTSPQDKGTYQDGGTRKYIQKAHVILFDIKEKKILKIFDDVDFTPVTGWDHPEGKKLYVLPNTNYGSSLAINSQYIAIGVDHQDMVSVYDLKSKDIKVIINVTKEIPNYYEDEFKYFKIPVSDTKESSMKIYFKDVLNFIKENKDEKLLIHCYHGSSRSSTVVILYLMSKYNMEIEECIELLTTKRDIVNLNKTFFEELKEYYDNILNKDKSTYKSTNDEPTPIDCIQEMISKIPDELWNRNNLKIMDPCCGNGNFFIPIVYKLLDKYIQDNMYDLLGYLKVEGDDVEFIKSMKEYKDDIQPSYKDLLKMNYIELDNITIPIQYDIKSKKFSAKLYLKSYEINNK